jgi:hypothetical protein
MRARFAATLWLLVFVPLANSAHALPVTRISVDTSKGPSVFKVEVAGDHASQEKGLMYRKKMAANAGMIFDFHQDVMTSFWMKNTILPLDIIFIRSDGTISSIAADAVPMSETPIPSSEPVRAVLELNAGRAAAMGIIPGAKVHAAIFGNAR